ncbi:MAG: nucleoside deaminase [Acidimicrobiia bacterium]
MRRALELAWESTCAGSFGIGAVAVDGAGHLVATGRNRILEVDPGEDVIANSSLAHAEMNVLAKLPYRRFEDAGLELHTTLQPCIQCLGAIRLSSIRHVHVLAPDPLWRGIERIVEHNAFLARNWPTIEEVPVTEWSVFALLLPTHLAAFWGNAAPGWHEAVPVVAALARELVASGELVAAAADGASLDEVAGSLWVRLSACVDEVTTLATLG